MPTGAQVRDAAERYLDAIVKRDIDAILACFSPDAVQRDPVTSPPNVGHEAIRVFFENALGASEAWHVTRHQILACGSAGASMFTLKVEVGGSAMEFDVIEVIEVRDDGTISSLDAYWDPDQIRMVS